MVRLAIATCVVMVGCHPRAAPTQASDADCCCHYVETYTIPGDGSDDPDRTELVAVDGVMPAETCVGNAHYGECTPAISGSCETPAPPRQSRNRLDVEPAVRY